MRAARRTAGLLAAGVLALSGCGGDETEPSSSVPDSAPFNDADVAFATEMIAHHAQALMMVDMAATRKSSPEFGALLEQIRAAQAPEIEQMTDWLQEWDQPVPENPRDHANMGHDGEGAREGMEGMEDLEEERGAAFEEAWLEAMIEHHEGAVDMAEEQVEDGEYADAIALAEDIVASQGAEIEQMESMLD